MPKTETPSAAELVARIMDALKIDQDEVARITQTSQPTVWRWLHGVNQPSKPAWDKLMKHAVKHPETVGLVHAYILDLLGPHVDTLTDLMKAALARKTG